MSQHANLQNEIESVLDELEELDGIDWSDRPVHEVEELWDLRDRLLELIDESLDEASISDAEYVWWNDQAEFHLYCSTHYHEISNEQWTGFTQTDNHDEIRKAARERLDNGALCERCHSNRLYERRDELLAERDLDD